MHKGEDGSLYKFGLRTAADPCNFSSEPCSKMFIVTSQLVVLFYIQWQTR